MSLFDELVQSARLETRYCSSTTTVHIFYEIGQHADQRRLRREETWVKQKEIGHGAYGSVWLEECSTGLGTKVRAVKSIKKFNPYRPSESSNRDFARELGAVTKFSHPKYETCFVKSTGWFENDDSMFIAMEYLRHGDLQAYLNRSPPLPETQGREIAFQATQGLYYMHHHGFAHRDLKPGNILIKSMPPDNWWVKLCDFGTSKNHAHDITRSTVKGTLAYMAPEVLKMVDAFKEETSMDNTTVDNQAVDMWALGEIVYRLLTGKPTFPSPLMLLKHADNAGPLPLDHLRNLHITDDACHFIESLMQGRPGDRLTAQEALQEEWMGVYESTVSEILGYNTSSPPIVSSLPVRTSAIVDLEPSAEWSTAVTGRSGNPFRLTLPGPSTGLAKPAEHPSLVRSSVSENDVHSTPPPTKDWRRKSTSFQSNNPYRNGLFDTMRDTATKRVESPAEPLLLIPDDDPPSYRTAYSHISKARSNDSGVGDMSGESSYDAERNRDTRPAPPNTSMLAIPQKDEGPWHARIGDFVKGRMKRLEGIVTDQVFSQPAAPLPQNANLASREELQEPRPRSGSSQEIVLRDNSGQSKDPDANYQHNTVTEKKRLARPKNPQDIVHDKENNVRPSKSAKPSIPPPIPGLHVIYMGEDTYRKQVRNLISARRLRRQNAEIELALEHGLEVDLVTNSLTEHGRRIGELPIDSYFEFSIKMWFLDLPRSQYNMYARQTLMLMSITFSETEEGFECWSDGSGGEESIHFRFAFWSEEGVSISSPIPFLIDKKVVVTSGTHFRFQRLNGDLQQYEDLMEKVVGMFEKRWYADPENPR